MTEKLFYSDPFLRSFPAAVLSCEKSKDLWAVTLDRTAFYPEGGGQPADHGSLGPAAVLDVHAQGDDVIHLCDGPLSPGSSVTGSIDWDRRFDFMQQHSGEHIVSGIICSRFHCDNVGFHIGHDLVTIDFNTSISPEQLREVEYAANRYIWEDHNVEISFPSPGQLSSLDYRSKKALSGQVRIVSWPGADCCACCGTHLRSSGQAGLILLLSCQKFRDGVRIEMAAGKRALTYCSNVLQQNLSICHLLSAKPLDTAAAVQRTLDSLYSLRGRVAELEESDFAEKAQRFAGAGDVLLFQGPMSPDSLRKLCAAVSASCGGRCAIFSGDNSQYIYAISLQNGDLRPLCKSLNAALNGRGGGKPDFVQGSVLADAAQINDFFLNL